MFTVNPDDLAKLTAENRIWQGIPSIAVTKGGKQFVTFYSGGTHECIGNYVVVLEGSDTKEFGEPIAAAVPDSEHRCYDPNIWIDPLDRLWVFWSVAPDEAVYAVICENPDADTLVFGEEFKIGSDIMMNKPTVLSTGEWLFPVAVWPKYMAVVNRCNIDESRIGSNAYITGDCGKTFKWIKGPSLPQTSFNEHMFLEHIDGSISVYVRMTYGVGTAISYDGGYTWAKGGPSDIAGPSSRFSISRLPSGRVLLVNHFNFTGRNNLTALLSEDDGKTWKYRLLLDERDSVSYPDVSLHGGNIYIVYDHDRGAFKSCIEDALNSAREILSAKITEDDIIAGKLVSKGSYLKRIVSKLTVYNGECKNPYDKKSKYSACELAEFLINEYGKEKAIEKVFELNPICCDKKHNVDWEKLDSLFNDFCVGDTGDISVLTQIIATMRLANKSEITKSVISSVIEYIENNLQEQITLEKISQTFSISKYYLSHLFKVETGLGVIQFCNERRIYKAKKLLNGEKQISEIAEICGYGDISYFSRMFKKSVGISPNDYRKQFAETINISGN